MSNHSETERDGPATRSSGEGLKESKETLAKGGEQMKDEAARATAEVRQRGSEIASTAVEQAETYAYEQKKAGAQHVANFARAVERAADELEGSSPELAQYAHSAASTVSRFSDTLRQSNVRELLDEANDFARREPALFFGAAIVAGMALSRFLRSSAERGATTENSRHAGTPATPSGRHA
jgi:hypothetical protein